LNEQCTEKTYTDYRYRVARLNCCTAENVHRTGQRFAQEIGCRRFIWQNKDVVGRCDLIFCKAVLSEISDAISRPDLLRIRTDGIDYPNRFVAGGSCWEGIVKPRPPLPRRNIGCAHPTMENSNPNLGGTRFYQRHPLQFDVLRP
jgi:hypothetical protein